MEQYNLYKDIQARTNGEIYLGVVGAVRTGKSTFIKRFMEQMVIPNMEDENVRARTRDELPQSAQGKPAGIWKTAWSAWSKRRGQNRRSRFHRRRKQGHAR